MLVELLTVILGNCPESVHAWMVEEMETVADYITKEIHCKQMQHTNLMHQ